MGPPHLNKLGLAVGSWSVVCVVIAFVDIGVVSCMCMSSTCIVGGCSTCIMFT